ncbi:MAG: hypothetical protein Q4A09_02025 [Capnocytophaga felis]|nr:hypothetical protein [Capnocytophaga felis]
MKYTNIREEELKNKVGADWFQHCDTTKIIGNIDFSVFPAEDNLFRNVSLLWAEAKTGNFDVVTMFVQLVLTIGKARTFDKILPPAFLGAFDFKKFAFVPYNDIQDVFYLNDFNWNVTPSNHEAKEFLLIKERIEKTLAQNAYVFDFLKDEKELKFFIKNNITNSSQTAKIKIDKNNFLPIYLRWLEVVKPIIEVPDWDKLKKENILDADFYLADLFVDDKNTSKIEDDTAIRENLFVIFQNQGYKIAKENLKLLFDATINIKNKEAYQAFWKLYKRPPLKEYQEYIIQRRDLLVPQDIRERKGAFFTPRQWVELSQKYLTDYLGENWQDDYYIWDCAAGTGNLLAGLTNKYNIYASTLDQADVNVMHERAEHGANLLKTHCFQFDFLNDEFIPQSQGGKLPDSLFEVISNEEKRKKLVIYINPPYAEAGTTRQRTGTGQNKANVSKGSKTHTKYKPLIKQAANEIFALFLIRIYKEIPLSKIAEFSTLKILQSSNFSDFRREFRAKLEKIFIVPANTFDNVKGNFPIGFKIWNGEVDELFDRIISTAYTYEEEEIKRDIDEVFILPQSYITKWIKKDKINFVIGMMNSGRTDFQNQNLVNIQYEISAEKSHASIINITHQTLIRASIFFSVRWAIKATWKNDRRQFEIPNDGWQSDADFQNDCLAFTLFHGQNRISSSIPLTPEGGTTPSPSERAGGEDCRGINHWIPFTEAEVNAPERFTSHFMTDFIKGKIPLQSSPNPSQGGETNSQLAFKFEETHTAPSPSERVGERKFSPEATAVFDAGRELWRYYFQAISNRQKAESLPPTAYSLQPSLYDIREYFQGRSVAPTGDNKKGRMNNKSEDEHYNQLIGNLREALKILADKIKPKVFEYGFLRK